jgi:hypothetical protein
MYGAGKEWREKAARYVKTFGLFPVRSILVEERGETLPPDIDTAEGRRQARRDADAMERFFEAHHVLLSAGRLAEHTVRQLCEHDEGPCGMAELIALRNGLSALADHRGMTERRKGARRAG